MHLFHSSSPSKTERKAPKIDWCGPSTPACRRTEVRRVRSANNTSNTIVSRARLARNTKESLLSSYVLPLRFAPAALVSSTRAFHSRSSRFVPKVVSTCPRPLLPISEALPGSLVHTRRASPKASGVGSRRKPVSPSLTVSSGPPEATARTGVPAYMASMGTIPKCSRSGVYTTHRAVWKSVARSLSEMSRRKSTSTPSLFARAPSSPRYSTFSAFCVS
mmetsp:Transcript_19577/g.40392  ORF Transcript_19577/g.40392 Transcript_19577/m.40392 type:complete len:219 (+) Transcript_19577:279-935(+)